jgi:hypothetical protein
MSTLSSAIAAGVNPPPSGAYPFIFTDESGVVPSSVTQPFYGIGLIKVADVGRWANDLNVLLDRYIATVSKAGVARPRSHHEFHFASLTTGTRPFYEQLIDFFVGQPDGFFCALVIDKTQPGVDPIAVCGTPWDALIKYSITVLKQNISPNEKAIVIADNYTKPRRSPYYFERSLVNGLKEKVANVVMVESTASIMLQLVDVLLGCVMYHFKAPKLAVVDADKKAVADRLAAAYGVPTLAAQITRNRPAYSNHFNVWKYTPRKPAVPGPRAARSGP